MPLVIINNTEEIPEEWKQQDGRYQTPMVMVDFGNVHSNGGFGTHLTLSPTVETSEWRNAYGIQFHHDASAYRQVTSAPCKFIGIAQNDGSIFWTYIPQ